MQRARWSRMAMALPVVLLGSLSVGACSAVGSPATPQPSATPTPQQAGLDYGGYRARQLPSPPPDVFRFDATRLRDHDEYRAIAAPVRQLVRTELDVAGF